MQIEPSETAFAERYRRGEPQVVWTSLVADLETPVSAFLKLGGGKALSFLLEFGRGWRRPWPLFNYRSRAGSNLANKRRKGRGQPQRPQQTACI